MKNLLDIVSKCSNVWVWKPRMCSSFLQEMNIWNIFLTLLIFHKKVSSYMMSCEYYYQQTSFLKIFKMQEMRQPFGILKQALSKHFFGDTWLYNYNHCNIFLLQYVWLPTSCLYDGPQNENWNCSKLNKVPEKNLYAGYIPLPHQ